MFTILDSNYKSDWDYSENRIDFYGISIYTL
ncbi:hypothetical protein BSF42_28500 [Flavobacterium sp. ACN6]|nr:hypothetical protein BSF42_28500 [Flavobacterium sp. ACN6]